MSHAAVLDLPTADTLHSELLGAITVGAEERLHFPAGVYGFPAARAFALVASGRDGLWWLQSAEDPALVFLVADPFHFFFDYAPEVPDAELAPLGGAHGTAAAADVALFAIVTLPGAGERGASANLRAPIVVDLRTRTARQVVLPTETRGVAEPIAIG